MKEYTVQRVLGGDVGIEDAIWKGIPALSVNCFPWPAFEKKITTTAKLASTASGLLVHFETDERPLLAQKTENNSQVCEDSCLEFFFRTEDTLKYINLEINPLGTIHADFDRLYLWHNGKVRKETGQHTPIFDDVIKLIEKNIDTEKVN